MKRPGHLSKSISEAAIRILSRLNTLMRYSLHQSRSIPLICVTMIASLLVTTSGCTAEETNLPGIRSFENQPSDRFLVDIKDVGRGHPFLGRHSPKPHAGGHVHFDNRQNRWPNQVDHPEKYPPIYAVADGIVSRIDRSFRVGQNDRYGIDLSFARDTQGKQVRFCYSIEPMIPEPSPNFYSRFILVRDGQKVKKGDVIAYMYTPPQLDSCHIHFHLMIDGQSGFLSPSIFDAEIARAFHTQCEGFRWMNQGTPLPPCIGFQISEEENPFGTGRRETQ